MNKCNLKKKNQNNLSMMERNDNIEPSAIVRDDMTQQHAQIKI